jgi:hypothetical protein
MVLLLWTRKHGKKSLKNNSFLKKRGTPHDEGQSDFWSLYVPSRINVCRIVCSRINVCRIYVCRIVCSRIFDIYRYFQVNCRNYVIMSKTKLPDFKMSTNLLKMSNSFDLHIQPPTIVSSFYKQNRKKLFKLILYIIRIK